MNILMIILITLFTLWVWFKPAVDKVEDGYILWYNSTENERKYFKLW